MTIALALLLSVTALANDESSAQLGGCSLQGEWQLTDAGTKAHGRVLFKDTDGTVSATYRGTGPTPIDQFRDWQLSKIYCDAEFITFEVASWGEFWFFRKEKNRVSNDMTWIGRFRRHDDARVSEAVFFPLGRAR